MKEKTDGRWVSVVTDDLIARIEGGPGDSEVYGVVVDDTDGGEGVVEVCEVFIVNVCDYPAF